MIKTQPTSFCEVLKLTIPQLGLMLCHLCVSLTDMYVAGKLNASVLASLGIVSQVFTMFMLITSVFGSGCMVCVGQALGGGKKKRADLYGVLIVGLALGGGACIGLLAIVCLPVGLYFLEPELHSPVRVFWLAYACHLPFFYCLIIINSLFRAYKLVWFPVFTLCLIAIANYFGSIGFGLGAWGLPNYGYAGIAWTTFATGAFGLILNMGLAFRKNILNIKILPKLAWIKQAMHRLFSIGAPSTLSYISSQIGLLIVLAWLAKLPDALSAVAGLTIGLRIQGLTMFVPAALALSLTIISSHLLGAKEKKDCYALGLRFAAYSGGVMLFLAVAMYVGRFAISRQFSTDVQVLNQAQAFIAWTCLALPVQAAAQMLQSIFMGAGAARLSFISSCIGMWFMTLPLALGLGYWLGAKGIYIALMGGNVLTAILTLKFYVKKNWL